MADFEGLLDQVALLKRWSSELPREVRSAVSPPEVTADADSVAQTTSGERHGSWFLEIAWQIDSIAHSTTLALTNPTAIPDSTTTRVVVTATARASSTTRYVSETVFEQRRAISRISQAELQGWLLAGVERARGYNEASLNQAYSTGIGQ